MNKLSRHWLRYISLQTNANNKATALMRKYMEKYGTDDMQRIVDYAHALVDKYGEASAAIACELHDAVAKSQNVTVPPAKPAPVADIEEVAKAIYGVSKQSKDQIPNVVGRLVKQVGAEIGRAHV